MPVDLVVTAVKLPSPFRAPCKTTVVVTVTNQGSDPAIARSFDVAVDFSAVRDAPFQAQFLAKATGPDQRLQPGQSIQVPVAVNCPCQSPIWVRVDADPAVNVPDNLHSQPPFALQATPDLVPWLVASLRVGLVAPGKTIFDVGTFCPDAPIVAEVTLVNQGCVDTPSTQLDVTTEDTNGNVLSTQSTVVGAIRPRGTTVVLVNARTPPRANAPGRLFTVRATADAGMAIVDQCDRSTLSAIATLPLDAGRMPRLSLTNVIGGLVGISPGMAPRLHWTLVNDCSDIGGARIRVTYGTPPVELDYALWLVAPRSTLESDFFTKIPPAIANDFWTVGTRTLTFEVLGSGRDPGPYVSTLDLKVTASPPAWVWVPVPLAPPNWKSPYTIFGSFFPAAAAATVTLVDCVQHDTATTGALADSTRKPNVSVSAAMLASGATPIASSFTFNDRWTWVSQPYFYKSGPWFRDFEFRVRYTAIDVFGNNYGTVTSPPLSMSVVVSVSKLSSQMLANALTIAGTVLVAAGVICFAMSAWPYNLICVAMMAVGMALVIGGTLLGYDAMDPPIPDFGPHGSPYPPDPSRASGSPDSPESSESCPAATPTGGEWRLPCMEDHPAAATLAALNSLTSLMRHFVSRVKEAARARDLAHAAYIDGDRDALQQRKVECKSALDAIGRIVAALPDVLAEVEQRGFEQRVLPFAPLPKGKLPAGKELLKAVHERAKELEIAAADLETVTPALEQATPEFLKTGLASLRKDGLARMGALAQSWYDAQRAEYAAHPYLR